MNFLGGSANPSRRKGMKGKEEGPARSSPVGSTVPDIAASGVPHGGTGVPGELRLEVVLASFAYPALRSAGFLRSSSLRVAPSTALPSATLRASRASAATSGQAGEAPQFTLQPLSFTLRSGEVLAILGPNASGKSTLLGLLSGILPPLSGHVRLEGREMSTLDLRTRARKLAVVQQESPLPFSICVMDYVLQGRYPHLRPLQLETEADFYGAARALEATSAAHLHHRWMQALSGGEKQRVILARALAQQPEVLLLDEPTLHLDIGAQVDFLRLVRSLAAMENYAVAVVTHELNLAAEFADRILLLHRGRMVRLGPPEEVFERQILEQVFETPLEIERSSSGRPRVVIASEN